MVWEMTAEELVIRYDFGERNFAGCKIIPAHGFIDLKGFNLRGINLCGGNLTDANLAGADLTGADLTGVILTSACLEKAIIRDASLYSANLRWTNLSEADFRGTILSYMNATYAVFFKAKFQFPFERAILADADFRDSNVGIDVLYAHGNLLWNTIDCDGNVIVGPLYEDGKRGRSRR